MRHITIPKIKVIHSEDPQKFETQMNSMLEELAEYDPEITFKDIPQAFCAYLTYCITEDICETVEDEYAAKGQRHRCVECPYFEDFGDRRFHKGYCTEKEKNVQKDGSCCELYYSRLKKGVI